MVHSNHLKNKAAGFGIDLKASPEQGMVLVCKLMLVGIHHTLQQDPRQISKAYIDILEEDLREIRNEFELMSRQEVRKLMDLKLVKSASAIMKHTEEAHKKVFTASMMIENGSSAANYDAYIDCLNYCRRETNKALQYFLIQST